MTKINTQAGWVGKNGNNRKRSKNSKALPANKNGSLSRWFITRDSKKPILPITSVVTITHHCIRLKRQMFELHNNHLFNTRLDYYPGVLTVNDRLYLDVKNNLFSVEWGIHDGSFTIVSECFLKNREQHSAINTCLPNDLSRLVQIQDFKRVPWLTLFSSCTVLLN